MPVGLVGIIGSIDTNEFEIVCFLTVVLQGFSFTSSFVVLDFLISFISENVLGFKVGDLGDRGLFLTNFELAEEFVPESSDSSEVQCMVVKLLSWFWSSFKNFKAILRFRFSTEPVARAEETNGL